MKKVLIMGAGKIGTLIAFLLARENDFSVHLADQLSIQMNSALQALGDKILLAQLDAKNEKQLSDYIKHHQIDIVISSLPYFCNVIIAKIAAAHHIHYLDLTEDIATTKAVSDYAKKSKSIFVPQCGLAPGFISVVANELMQHFSKLDTVKMRVGALPKNSSNGLQYSLTWSTDGLINEYGNPCDAMQDGREVSILPLEGLEEIEIDGLKYEAFNTSGGLGSLSTTYKNKINHLNYKTIRYPGHCEKIKFLMNDLKLNSDRPTLKRIFENAIPRTDQDLVIVYVSVSGFINEQFTEKNYVKKLYPKNIEGQTWSAIQMTTACGICSALDLILDKTNALSGLVLQEQLSFKKFIQNRFGRYYAE